MSVSTTPETLPIYIDGSFRQARSGETIDAINPATGEVIARSRAATLRTSTTPWPPPRRRSTTGVPPRHERARWCVSSPT